MKQIHMSFLEYYSNWIWAVIGLAVVLTLLFMFVDSLDEDGINLKSYINTFVITSIVILLLSMCLAGIIYMAIKNDMYVVNTETKVTKFVNENKRGTDIEENTVYFVLNGVEYYNEVDSNTYYQKGDKIRVRNKGRYNVIKNNETNLKIQKLVE